MGTILGTIHVYDGEEKMHRRPKIDTTKRGNGEWTSAKNWSPYQPFVTLNELKTATHINGQRAKVMDQKNKKGRYPVKLEDGTLLSVKEENMIREDTRGAEGKNKGNERKEGTRTKKQAPKEAKENT